ncbi:hypothetical protein GCM10010199_47660 [Dactylosporangium roseum]
MASGLALVGCAEKRKRPTIRDAGGATGEVGGQTLQPLLDRRAAALQKGDERAFLADLDPNNAKLIEQQKMVFANLRQMKLAAFGYIAKRVYGARVENGVYQFAPVHEVVQLTADAGPGGVSPAGTFRVSAVKRGGKLVITELAGLTPDNAEQLGISNGLPAHAPWHLTPLKVSHAGNVCLIADASVTDLDRYAVPAEAEAKTLESLWGDRTRFPGYVLFFTNDERNFASWFSLGAASNFAPTVEGFQIPQYGVRQAGEIYREQYAGSRIVVNLRRIKDIGDDPRLVMRHELAHAISSRATAVSPGLWVLGAPRWALEGFARWTEGRGDVPRQYAAASFKGAIPHSRTFYDDSGYNYAVSCTVFDCVEKLKGRAAVVDFYHQVVQYVDLEDEQMVDTPAFDGICKKALGMSSADFKKRWAGFVRGGS